MQRSRLTRRGLLSSATTAAALALQSSPASAAAVPQPQQDQQPARTTTRDEDLANARQRIQTNSAALSKVKIPVAVEPAVVFKA